jgi:pyrroline-5-carboxylate reductase
VDARHADSMKLRHIIFNSYKSFVPSFYIPSFYIHTILYSPYFAPSFLLVFILLFMLSDQTIAFIGAGTIAQSIIGGLLRAENVKQDQIYATRRNHFALEELKAQFPNLHTTTDNAIAAKAANVVVLSVKPQNSKEVMEDIRKVITPNTLIISILAGITTDTICEALGQNLPVVRAMPNTPALVDAGATAVSGGKYALPEHVAIAEAIFNSVGDVERVPEYLMNAVTGLSGSGPAYIYMVIEALTDGGVNQGIPRPVALRLATQTVFGAAKMVIETGKHPAILRDEVTTPGGTTIAAIADLERSGLRTMFIKAVGEATQRAQELAKK